MKFLLWLLTSPFLAVFEYREYFRRPEQSRWARQVPADHCPLQSILQMFKKFFGGDDKKKEQAPPPAPPPAPVSKDVEAEKIIFNLDRQIGQLTDQSNKLENTAEVLTMKAKEFMAAEKRKEAKQIVSELTEVKKKIELINTRKKVIRTQKNQLEVAKIDLSLAEGMGEATKFMQALETVNEKMTDIMLDAKEIQSNMDETNRLMKELAGEDQEDEATDDLFKELQQQVESDKAAQITAGLNQNRPQVVKPVTVSTVSTNKSSAVEDDLAKWLN